MDHPLILKPKPTLHCQHSINIPVRHQSISQRRRHHQRHRFIVPSALGLDSIPMLGETLTMGTSELALVISSMVAVSSVVANYYASQLIETQRAELSMKADKDKLFREQVKEMQAALARYRGPLLESAIDLEQRLWHLAVDQCFDTRSAEDCAEDVRYLLFTTAQFLAFVEVVRREGPRERHFLIAGSPQGADTLSALVEGIRFVLAATPSYLLQWYEEGSERTHPGTRRRQLALHHLSDQGCQVDFSMYRSESESDAEDDGSSSSRGGRRGRKRRIIKGGTEGFEIICDDNMEQPLLRISRGYQRAIGTGMLVTPFGSERHYTRGYDDFCSRMENDPTFSRWLSKLEVEFSALTIGTPWMGQAPFPINSWSRVLLLQQLLVEVIDLLDPDCVRLSLDRRARLATVGWSPLPRVEMMRKRLQDLSGYLFDFDGKRTELGGLQDLLRPRSDMNSVVVVDNGGNNNNSGNNNGSNNGSAMNKGKSMTIVDGK